MPQYATYSIEAAATKRAGGHSRADIMSRHRPGRRLPPLLETWARLNRKVYLIDPLTCPKCGGRLRILSFIDNPIAIEKILRQLKLWDLPERSPPPIRSTTMEPDADFLDWAATARQPDGID